MSAEIYQFLPRANHKADKAFWLGPDREAILKAGAVEIERVSVVDTSPSEYVAPSDDCA